MWSRQIQVSTSRQCSMIAWLSLGSEHCVGGHGRVCVCVCGGGAVATIINSGIVNTV